MLKRQKYSSLVLILCAAFAFNAVSCAPGGIKSSRDEQIKQDLRSQIQQLNQQIFDSIKKDDAAVVIGLAVDEVKKDPQFPEKIKIMYKQLKPLVEKLKLETYHEFHVLNKKPQAKNILITSKTEEPFQLSVQGGYSETYVSFITSKGSFRDPLLAFVYVREKDQWRLYGFHVGVLRVSGKTAMEWLKEAKSFSGKGYHVPAVLRMKIGKLCVRPVPFMQFDKEKEWNAFGQKLLSKVNLKLPLQLSEVKGQPEIFGVDASFDNQELVPAVQYVTKIPLEKTAELQTEADAIAAALPKAIPGIEKGANSIFFRAFSELPQDPKKEYTFYGLKADVK